MFLTLFSQLVRLAWIPFSFYFHSRHTKNPYQILRPSVLCCWYKDVELVTNVPHTNQLKTYYCLRQGSAPCYLQQTDMESRRRLRSVTSSDLMVPATRRSTLGDRAFTVAGPRAWNNLLDANRHSPSLETFKRSLKSHLFLQCFFLLSLSFLDFV